MAELDLSRIPNWPHDPKAFIFVPKHANTQAQLTALAICDAKGHARKRFAQGELAVIYTEWEIRRELEANQMLSSGIVLRDDAGNTIFGKNTYQVEPAPRLQLKSRKPGWRLRARYILTLRLAPGKYRLTVGLARVAQAIYEQYIQGVLGYMGFASAINEMFRVEDIAAIWVDLPPQGKLLHHGMTDLVEDAIFEIVPPNAVRFETAVQQPKPAFLAEDPLPALIHVTHQKAGSQWIRQILQTAFPERVVPPTLQSAHFLQEPVKQGKIYPTVYLSKEEFDQAHLPPKWHRFVVIRDLRDTLISAYFSIKVSHPPIGPIPIWRAMLNQMSQEEGLLWVLEHWLPAMARIQFSWWRAGERLIRYEDLVQYDVEIFKRIIIDEAGWPISPTRLEEIVIANRFENLTGRKRGEENIQAHARKGIAGDWRNYFTPRLKEIFKAHYGGLLVALGYEKDLSW